MKIIIVSNFFYPEITPRAFRTTELAKELIKRGNEVEVIIPKKDIYQNNPLKLKGLKVKYGSTSNSKISSPTRVNRNINRKKSKYLENIKKIIRECRQYFLPREIFQTYNKGITKVLKEIEYQPDILISISQPLSIHLSVFISALKNKNIKNSVKIGEFSDPIFKGEYTKTFPFNLIFGFLFSNCFDFFVIPTKNALDAYKIFKREEKIKVIPQGFDLRNVKLKTYINNQVPTFAYAGRFYEKLRNPEYFFQFLTKVDNKFKFLLFVQNNDLLLDELLLKYKNQIKGEILLCPMLPREELIYELSAVDFLINFENENSLMVPSKLIDYSLTSRPILSFNSRTFRAHVFYEFIDKNYDQQVKISLEEYDINNVVDQFQHLYAKIKEDKKH